MRTTNDKILTSARNYINSADDKVREFHEPRASICSRLPSLMASSKTSSQRKHDYVIAKMKREETEKQNQAAIRLAKQKKQMELDELEENNRKRLAEATLQEFELLDAVSKGSQSETTPSARSSMRSEKAVQDWINTSLALSFNNEEKTGEPEVTKDPPECPSHNNGGAVADHNTDISRHSIQKNCRGNYILSNETLQQFDPYYTPPGNFLAPANTQALYQANLRAQMNQTGQQGMALPSIINHGTADNHPHLYTAQGLLHCPFNSLFHHSSPQRKKIKIMKPSYFQTRNFKLLNPGDLKHQVYPRIIRPSGYAPDNKLILSPEHQTPLFLFFRQQIIQSPQ